MPVILAHPIYLWNTLHSRNCFQDGSTIQEVIFVNDTPNTWGNDVLQSALRGLVDAGSKAV
jgi:hypothetical protein